jgi:zinc/manganese transport system substrate-binding protein
MKIAKIALTAFLLILALPAGAALNVFACTPEWGALAAELGGEQVNVFNATGALQDPHRIEARPSLIARARNADLVICTGAELEIAWLPQVQAQSGNPRIQAGRPGYFEAAAHVALIEKPQNLDRAAGDVHAEGNPHIHLDPRNVAKIGAALTERMAALDAAQAPAYRRQGSAFQERWSAATLEWERRATPLKGAGFVVYHKNLSYLMRWLGMREVGNLEPKPGLPPTTAHLAELLKLLQREPARAVVRSAYNDPRAAQWLAERAKIPSVVVPFTVGGTERAKDLYGLFDDTIARLLESVR